MKSFRIAITLFATVIVALTISDLQAQPTPGPPTTTTTAAIPRITSRTTSIDRQQVGQVLIGSTVVMEIYGSAGGYTPGERASMVATRLERLLRQGYGWRDIQVGRQNREVVLLVGNTTLITVDRTQARLQNTTRKRLAADWQSRIQNALRSSQSGAGGGGGGTSGQWPDWTNATTRIVPILSLGTPGLRLGAAQITGPSDRVRNVDAVLQLDAEFQRVARIRAFIPSSSLTSVRRVQGVAVTALLQYRAFTF